MNKYEREIIEIFDSYDTAIKERLFKDLVESYSILLTEIDKRGLARKSSFEFPRLNYFLKSLFFFLFEKLHKGNKSEAFKLIDELKLQSSFLNEYLHNCSVPVFVSDDKAYANVEFVSIINKFEEDLKNNLGDVIIDIYNKTIFEIHSKNLVQRSGCSQPNLEKFIKVVFSFIFAKLHKGDKLKAREIINVELEKLE